MHDDDDDIEFHTPKKKKEPPKIIVYIVMIIIGFFAIKWCVQLPTGEERYQDAINNVRLPDGWSENGDQVRAITNVIKGYGYKCDKINSVVGNSHRGFSVSCNDYRYTYDVKDVGGNWIATAK